jgi:hypothetical protein
MAEHVCKPDENYSPPIADCWREHKTEILAWLDDPKRLGGPFSWPDDGLAGKPWQYRFHVAWVSAWNAEGRQTKPVIFIKRFLEDSQ